jgi:hypothetical protein
MKWIIFLPFLVGFTFGVTPGSLGLGQDTMYVTNPEDFDINAMVKTGDEIIDLLVPANSIERVKLDNPIDSVLVTATHESDSISIRVSVEQESYVVYYVVSLVLLSLICIVAALLVW